jgi:voltage-gated potassium channel
MDALRFRLRFLAATFVVLIILGTVGFVVIEGLSAADAFYFSIVTVTTVGYGDIHPATYAGKVLVIILIICGVGTFLGVVASATEILLNRREKRVLLEKLNMLIGTFFSEVGTKLLAYLSDWDPNLDRIREELIVTNQWSEREFVAVSKSLKNHDYGVEIGKVDFEDLRTFLGQKEDFLLRLLENPNLLEHESFTELLRAVFHLKEELASRKDFEGLPHTDYEHLAGDIKRAYVLLVHQWLDYMKHLKDNYPYLFSLAMRTNPFDQQASPIVK